jgi:SAM-dependent methyltransferase
MAANEAARAYNAIAADYDRQLVGDTWMRRALWTRYSQAFRAGQRVLDVGCGTGDDAIYLAQRGVSVVALDVSAEMIARLRHKAAQAGVEARIEPIVGDFRDLTRWPDGSFDGIISAFAGLSTVPDLLPFAADAARLLRPRGRLIVHLLNRFSLWDWLGALARGEWQRARQLRSGRERRFVVGGVPVRHYLLAADEAYRRFFIPFFDLRAARGYGIFRPPHTVQAVPAWLVSALARIDRLVESTPPFAGWGRFFVLDLERRVLLPTGSEGRQR